jgi:integrase/recombinase XerD
METVLPRARLHIYKGHEKSCQHRATGRAKENCRCTWWVDGTINGKRCNKSLRTRNREVALDAVREMEVKGNFIGHRAPRTLSEACKEFLADAKARGLREPTQYKYRLLLRRLEAFGLNIGIRFIEELTLDALRKFRSDWPYRGSSANKRLEELRAFGRFCWESGWILENPAKRMKPQIVTEPPREPFAEDEVHRILAACGDYPHSGCADVHRLRCFVDLLLETGLRIGDAVQIRRNSLVNGKLHLRTEKTGTSVYLPLSASLVEELQMVRGVCSEYFFWSGRGKKKSCIGDWQRTLKRLFLLAKVPNGCAHRFRHTFAKRYLLEGVPPDRVAILLGHKSQAVTLKYYAHWVRERQEQLEADVRIVQQKYARYSLDGGVNSQQIQ